MEERGKQIHYPPGPEKAVGHEALLGKLDVNEHTHEAV